MAFDDFLADSQPNTGTGILLTAVQALEYHEYTLGVLRVDPDAIVSH